MTTTKLLLGRFTLLLTLGFCVLLRRLKDELRCARIDTRSSALPRL